MSIVFDQNWKVADPDYTARHGEYQDILNVVNEDDIRRAWVDATAHFPPGPPAQLLAVGVAPDDVHAVTIEQGMHQPQDLRDGGFTLHFTARHNDQAYHLYVGQTDDGSYFIRKITWVERKPELKQQERDQAIRPTRTDNPGENCLRELATTAAKKFGLLVELGARQDSAVGWFAPAIHPLQSLETVHQSVVQTAGRTGQNAEEREELELDRLSRFFVHDTREPELLKEADNDGEDQDDSAAARFSAAQKDLDAVRRELRHLPQGKGVDYADYFARAKARVRASFDELSDVRASFYQYPGQRQGVQVPILQEADRLVREALAAVDACQSSDELEQVIKRQSDDLLMEMERATEGVVKIQMLYGIDSFYLFRLLVPFQITSDRGVTADQRRDVSGELTGLLNNTMPWVSEWLRSKMVDLAAALLAEDPNQERTAFYLKGGRAQAFLLQNPEAGTNDWDTSIVINPELPAEHWYDTYNKVHNIVLQKLRQFKQEFFVLLHEHADEVAVAMVRKPLEAEAEYAADYDLLQEMAILFADQVADGTNPRASTKAELIDIGIPRRGSIEAIDQWHHTRPHLIRRDNVPIPGHLYYVDEYTLMIRESLAGLSTSPHKTAKRADRLAQIVNRQDAELDQIIAGVRVKIGANMLQQSLALAGQAHRPLFVHRMLPVMLEQFAQAYDLESEPGLETAFDNRFLQESENLAAIGNAIAADMRRGLAGPQLEMLQWLGLANRLSENFERHLRDRAAFFGFGQDQATTAPQAQRRETLEGLIRALYAGSVFSQTEELEVQCAVTGSFAAFLHADYARLAQNLKGKLAPVNAIELTLFCRDPNVDPIVVRDTLVMPAIQAYLSTITNPRFTTQSRLDGSVLIYWPNDETIGDFTYRPLAVKIAVERNVWPQLAYVWGFPVLSLRDLVRETDRKAAMTAEWGRRRQLKEASAILAELLVRFEQPAPTFVIRFLDQAGQPVVGTHVRYLGKQHGAVALVVQTDAHGQIRIGGKPEDYGVYPTDYPNSNLNGYLRDLRLNQHLDFGFLTMHIEAG